MVASTILKKTMKSNGKKVAQSNEARRRDPPLGDFRVYKGLMRDLQLGRITKGQFDIKVKKLDLGFKGTVKM